MGLMNLPNPPEDIGLKEYFETWLPEQIAPINPMIKEHAPDLDMAVGFRAEGEDGGDWTLVVKDGQAGTRPGLSDDALLYVILSAGHMKEFITGKRKMMPGMGAGGGGEVKPDKAAKQMKKTAEAIKNVKGMIEFRVKSEEDPLQARINFGPLQDSPTVTITVAESDMKAMQSGELNPQSAFMSGKIKVDGDFGFLMQLAPLAMG